MRSPERNGNRNNQNCESRAPEKGTVQVWNPARKAVNPGWSMPSQPPDHYSQGRDVRSEAPSWGRTQGAQLPPFIARPKVTRQGEAVPRSLRPLAAGPGLR